MSQKYLLSMILCLPMGCAPQGKIDSINRALALFVPHPWCTIGRTWDPDIDKPSCSAGKQLSPSGTKLRIGMPTQNKAYAIRVGSVVYGPGVDISCRLGAKLHLPIEFHTYATQDTWVTG